MDLKELYAKSAEIDKERERLRKARKKLGVKKAKIQKQIIALQDEDLTDWWTKCRENAIKSVNI